MVAWAYPSPHPNDILIGSAVLAQRQVISNIQTHTRRTLVAISRVATLPVCDADFQNTDIFVTVARHLTINIVI